MTICSVTDLEEDWSGLSPLTNILNSFYHKNPHFAYFNTSCYSFQSTQQLFDDLSRKSSPFIESDYDNTTLIEDPHK